MEKKLFKISLVSFLITYILPFLLAMIFPYIDYIFNSDFLTQSLSGTFPEYTNPIYYNFLIQLGAFVWYIFLVVKVKKDGKIRLFLWYLFNIILAILTIWFAYELSHNTKGSLLNNNI
ncbi:hypothetical protein [Mesonia sp. K4-1]|jgi:hypothetical protein|uniref:hypothetical protein n=1 Tax=Mesonia sp. K4-1 TaxID=2602760 RepID=UPI0011CC573B|nr:hypothetical protein [Mesonia sp. K4-1]TXK74880.1 hypothetical protein FT986_10255 [Mesonia sp. K4-1]|tara:strand:+ start:222 stop:575 length:354 start_codon:yes stop_codon:yes gene_type:complete